MQSSSVYQEALDTFIRDFGRFSGDFQIWAQRTTDGERVIGICVFALMLLFIMIRRPANAKESGSMGRQFVFALAIVVIFGFGVGWMFDGSFNIPTFS